MCPFQNHLHISKHAGRAGFFHCTSFYEISLLNSHPLILITQVSDSLSRASSISLKSSAACQEITGSKSSDPTLQKCWMTLVFIKLCTLNWNFVLWELVIKKTTMDFPLHKVKDFYLKKKQRVRYIIEERLQCMNHTKRCSWSQKFKLDVLFDRLPNPWRNNAPPAAHSPSHGWKSIHPRMSFELVIWCRKSLCSLSLLTALVRIIKPNWKSQRHWNTISVVILN